MIVDTLGFHTLVAVRFIDLDTAAEGMRTDPAVACVRLAAGSLAIPPLSLWAPWIPRVDEDLIGLSVASSPADRERPV